MSSDPHRGAVQRDCPSAPWTAPWTSETPIPHKAVPPHFISQPQRHYFVPAADAAAGASADLFPATRGAADCAPDALDGAVVSAAAAARRRFAHPFLQALLERRPADVTAAADAPYLKFLSPMVRYSKLPFRLLCRRYGADLAFTPMLVAKDLNRSGFANDLAAQPSPLWAAAQADAAQTAARSVVRGSAGDEDGDGSRRRLSSGANSGGGAVTSFAVVTPATDAAAEADPSALLAAAADTDAASLSLLQQQQLQRQRSCCHSSGAYSVLTGGAGAWGTEAAGTAAFASAVGARDPFALRLSLEEFSTAPADRPLVAQLAANDPVEVSRAAAALARYVDGVDLNCGCPQTWVIQQKIGAALSARPEAVAELVRAARATLPADKTVSLKIRLRPDLRQTVELVRRAEAAGADWVTVHGRTREERTQTAVRADAIALLRSVATVPVIYNGDLTTPAEMDAAAAGTGAAGVLLARGALANPGLFCGAAALPARAVADYADLALRYGSLFPMHLHHLTYMLFAPLAKARRSALARAKSAAAALVDSGAAAAGRWGGAGFDRGTATGAAAAATGTATASGSQRQSKRQSRRTRACGSGGVWGAGAYSRWGYGADGTDDDEGDDGTHGGIGFGEDEDEAAAVRCAAEAEAARVLRSAAAAAADCGRRCPVYSVSASGRGLGLGLDLERRFAPEVSPSEVRRIPSI